MKTASVNDTVKVHYTCITNDGEKYSSRDSYDPITFIVGKGRLLKPLEEATIGMKINEKKNISISEEQAYGPWRKDLVRIVDKTIIPDEIDLKEGLELYFTLHDGRDQAVRILEVKEKVIVIDENHYLAGKDLKFEIELIEIL